MARQEATAKAMPAAYINLVATEDPGSVIAWLFAVGAKAGRINSFVRTATIACVHPGRTGQLRLYRLEAGLQLDVFFGRLTANRFCLRVDCRLLFTVEPQQHKICRKKA